MSLPICCTTLQEVRDQIDRVDTLIVNLIAERTEYVVQAARFKDTKEAVRIPTRIESIIGRVRALARETGLDPAMVESVYRHHKSVFAPHPGPLSLFATREARHYSADGYRLVAGEIANRLMISH